MKGSGSRRGNKSEEANIYIYIYGTSRGAIRGGTSGRGPTLVRRSWCEFKDPRLQRVEKLERP